VSNKEGAFILFLHASIKLESVLLYYT